MSMRRLAALAALSILSGCAGSAEFDGQIVIDGIDGKSWRTPTFVDSPIYRPGALSNMELAMDFDVASYGTSLQFVGSLWDPLTTSTYRGYARLYQDGIGWSTFGPYFGQIATDGTNSFSSVSTAVDPNGLFMANLFTSTTRGASAAYSTSGWELATNNTGLASVPAGAGSVASTMDADGNGYVFFLDASGVWQAPWSTDTTNGLSSPDLIQISTGAAQANSGLTARFDGASHVCVTYEDLAATLLSSCEDVTGTGPFSFAAASAQTLATDVAGHETATDGEGGIMAVYYQDSGSGSHIYASLASSGTWASSGTQIDDQDDGFETPSPSGAYTITGARPGVAYVGSGRYLAVWVGIDSSSSSPATQLYSNLYDPGEGGWQGAEAIADTLDSFSASGATPHPRSLTVFGNGDGNAGYALNKIHTSDDIGGTHTGSIPAIYPESAHVRVLEVNRWQKGDGWVGATTLSDTTCFNQYDSTSPWLADDNSGDDPDCAHRPLGVIFPSGNTLVFFQAQDGYSASSVPGNRRVAVVSFE